MVSSVFRSFLLGLIAFGGVYALPVGNPADASLYLRGLGTGETRSDPCVVKFNYGDILRLKGGFYGDYVFNREMEVYHAQLNLTDIKEFSINTNAAYLALNLFDWVDFFGIVGATHIDLLTNGEAYSNNSTLVRLNLTTQTCWGAGTHVTLCKLGKLFLGVEGQYFRTMPHLDSIVRYENGSLHYFNSSPIFPYDEWQVGLGLTYRVHYKCISAEPYVAIKRARAEMVFDNYLFTDDLIVYSLKNLKSRKIWGFAAGMSTIMFQMIGVTIEGRFADEKACYINGQLRF